MIQIDRLITMPCKPLLVPVKAFWKRENKQQMSFVRSYLSEDDPCFNAGKGSVLDHSGKVTMDASFCDGTNVKFGGVINVPR